MSQTEAVQFVVPRSIPIQPPLLLLASMFLFSDGEGEVDDIIVCPWVKYPSSTCDKRQGMEDSSTKQIKIASSYYGGKEEDGFHV